MKKLFLVIAGLISLLATGICLGDGNTSYEKQSSSESAKPGKAKGSAIGIDSIQAPRNFRNYTVIPVLVENKNEDRVKDVSLILYGYDKKKKKLFESNLFSHWCSDMETSRWNSEDNSIMEKSVVQQNCRLPGSQYLYSKEFEEKYGNPEYYVVELYAGKDLVDVGAFPKRFFKYNIESDREKLIEEWSKFKSESAK